MLKYLIKILADFRMLLSNLSRRSLCLNAACLTLPFFLFSCQQTEPNPQLQRVINSGVLKVVTRNSPTTYYQVGEDFAGVEYELVMGFAESLGVEVEFIVKDNLKEINNLLTSGEVDLAAAGLSITAKRQKELRFAPAYQTISSKLVFKQGHRWPRNIAQLDGDLRVVAHSFHSQELLKLKNKYPSLHWSETSEQTPEELLMMVLDETIDYTIVDSIELDLNRRFNPDLMVAFSIGKPQKLAWAFANNQDDSLFVAAIKYFGNQYTQGRIGQLYEKYYGHVEKFDYVGARHFRKASQEKLENYKELFIDSAAKDIDWRLLAAISYQESHWNPKAKSPTGVRGMMMLTQNTAKQLGVTNRLDVKQSIRGGADYLRVVRQKVPDDIPEPDKTWFALAGYNVGWGHVEDARIITQMQGGDPHKWSDVKSRLPLLQKKKWYKQTKYGYARGQEPVDYVNNIRRYYEVLKWQDERPNEEMPDIANNKNKEESDKLAIAKEEQEDSQSE